jgi:hypothetical protein
MARNARVGLQEFGERCGCDGGGGEAAVDIVANVLQDLQEWAHVRRGRNVVCMAETKGEWGIYIRCKIGRTRNFKKSFA